MFRPGAAAGAPGRREGYRTSRGKALILNAVVWGVVIVACALELRGTDHKKKIVGLLATGAGLSSFVVGAGPG